MPINALGSGVSGLIANADRLNVSGHNVANVNTDGFKSQEIATTDAAYINDIGTGVRVSSVYSPSRPGPLAVDAAGGVDSGMVEMSNTDLIRETTNQMAAQKAYGANIATIRVADTMAQDLLNMVR